MLDKQIEKLGALVAQKQAETIAISEASIDRSIEEVRAQMVEERKQLLGELDAIIELISTTSDVSSAELGKRIDDLTATLRGQEVFEAMIETRLKELNDGQDGKDGKDGEAGQDGIDGMDKPLLEPVQLVLEKDYDKNTLGIHNGGLWISTKKAVGSPESDPHAWECILDSMTKLSIDMEEDHTFRLHVRMATGKLIEDTFNIPYPEHKGIWGEGEYKKGQIVTKGHNFWQAMEDTDGCPPGNGWKQILSAPRGKTGPAGKSIEGPQGKPGRNGLDAKLPPNFVDDIIKLASERKAFEDGRSDAYAITSYRGWFMNGEAYNAGDVVNFDGSMYLCTRGGTYDAIATSGGAFEVFLGVPKIAYVPYMHWQGEWVQKTYKQGMVVSDGGWAMVATAETDDRAAPTPIGDSAFPYDGTITPTSVSGKVLGTGMRYSPQVRTQLITGFRVYTTDTVNYRIYLVKDPLGSAVVYPIYGFTANSTGWQTFNSTGEFIQVGETVDVVLAIDQPDPTPTTWFSNYDYNTPNNPSVPNIGDIVHANTASASLRIHKIDNDLTDRSTELEALTPGDRIQGVGQDWAITGSTDNGTWMNFSVSPSSQGAPDGIETFYFQTVTESLIPYAEDVDYWVGQDAASGLYGVDVDYSELALNDNQYGIDVRLQDYIASDHWDVLAYTSGGSQPTLEVSLTDEEALWVRASSSPFHRSSQTTTGNIWSEVVRYTIPVGQGMKILTANDAKRTDDDGYFSSELSGMSFNNGIANVIYTEDFKHSTEPSVDTRIVIDGSDVVVEIRGATNQDWHWNSTIYAKEIE